MTAPAPRLAPTKVGKTWDRELVIDRGWAELTGLDISSSIACDQCEELDVVDSSVVGAGFELAERHQVNLRASSVDRCDLSGVTINSLRSSRVSDTKLIGTELSGSLLTDVLFERCVFRLTNFRSANLSRVAFSDCTLDDVDLFEARAEDVSFDGSSLQKVNVDRFSAQEVDFSGAVQLGLRGVGRLDGCLVGPEQLLALAPVLGQAVGLRVAEPHA